ncbi:MAG: glycosyltransferase [Chloroflexota bacterium]
MRILFLSRWFPFPPGNGSKLRIYNLLRALAAQHQLTLLSFLDHPSQQVALPAGERALFQAVYTMPWKPYDPQTLSARLGFFSATPRSVVDTYSPAMAGKIEEVLAAHDVDLVIASQFDTAVYCPTFRHLPAIFEEVEVGVYHDRYREATTTAGRLRNGLTWAKHTRYLARILTHFTACTVVSAREKELLQDVAPTFRPVSIIPNCLALEEYAATAATQPHTLIFTGSLTYDVNYEGMCWFVREVYPLVQQALPDVRLLITGDHGHRPFPQARGLQLTGFVDDVRSLIARSGVSLAPIFTGGGTRLKILEAMALRTPVVATAKGAEGLDAVDGRHLLLADEPQAFAAAVVRLLLQPHLRRQLADEAFQFVSQRYGCKATLSRFLQLVEEAGSHGARVS